VRDVAHAHRIQGLLLNLIRGNGRRRTELWRGRGSGRRKGCSSAAKRQEPTQFEELRELGHTLSCAGAQSLSGGRKGGLQLTQRVQQTKAVPWEWRGVYQSSVHTASVSDVTEQNYDREPQS